VVDDHTLLIQIDTDSFLTLVTTSSDKAIAFLETNYLLGAGLLGAGTFADETMARTSSNDVIDGGDGQRHHVRMRRHWRLLTTRLVLTGRQVGTMRPLGFGRLKMSWGSMMSGSIISPISTSWGLETACD